MAFAADFLGGLNQGLGRGMDMYAQLQNMANQQRQMQLQEQAQARLAQGQQIQDSQGKINALVNIGKIKDAGARKSIAGILGPSLGFDPNAPDYAALLDALGNDEGNAALLEIVRGAAGEAGVPPGMAALAAQADPNVATSAIFGFNRQQGSNELAQLRLAMAQERLGLSQQQLGLSEQRRQDQMYRFDQRLQGNIPPMGYAPQLGQQGDLRSLAPIPGGPATIPTEGERSAAAFGEVAKGSEAQALDWTQKNQDYLGSLTSKFDQLLANDKATGGIGSIVGGAAGSLTRSPWGIMAGAGAGASAGLAFQDVLEQTLTSPEGRAFKAAWSPFISSVVYGRSGKTINASEWSRALSEFIPMPQDNAEALAIKAKNRQNALNGLYLQGGRATPPGAMEGLTTVTPTQSTAPAPAPLGDTEIKSLATKYRSGSASPEEIQTLKNALRAKGINVR